jgi:hypothetical protein
MIIAGRVLKATLPSPGSEAGSSLRLRAAAQCRGSSGCRGRLGRHRDGPTVTVSRTVRARRWASLYMIVVTTSD